MRIRQSLDFEFLCRFNNIMFVLMLSGMFGCNTNSKQDDDTAENVVAVKTDTTLKSPEQAAPGTKALIGQYLTNFYINNTAAKPEFSSMLGKPGDTHKIVLQCFISEGGELNLVTYSGKSNNQEISRRTIFYVGRVLSGANEDMAGKNVYLGDEEIARKNVLAEGDLKTLRAARNKAGYEYIVFTPSLVKETGSNYYFINYDIGYTSDPTDVTKATEAHSFTVNSFSITSPNPSPPYNGR